ncbi:hypothetical protein PsorP6_000575 [Peronosclerospora sorghi]|uniref:Uncharacterized protein n=1 Tax=Peronosclerospora sorghi TaxID=230839 RepID=A0ACC0WQ00_9STRA|nr:hypothetical protein PsorP6_000575 [Peronosclerospora sorghi]
MDTKTEESQNVDTDELGMPNVFFGRGIYMPSSFPRKKGHVRRNNQPASKALAAPVPIHQMIPHRHLGYSAKQLPGLV